MTFLYRQLRQQSIGKRYKASSPSPMSSKRQGLSVDFGWMGYDKQTQAERFGLIHLCVTLVSWSSFLYLLEMRDSNENVSWRAVHVKIYRQVSGEIG